MAPTDVACGKALGDRDWKLSDGGCLFLLIKTTRMKSWRWNYTFVTVINWLLAVRRLSGRNQDKADISQLADSTYHVAYPLRQA